VAHACNPSYSGGRDQKDHSSKPAWAKQFPRTYLKKPHHKKGLVEWLRVLSSSPNTAKKKKKVKRKTIEGIKKKKKKVVVVVSWMLVAHTCVPNYSGGRNQEDRTLKPVWPNNLGDPISKKILHKKGLVEWLNV
jgi:hypothetical protein